MLKIFFEKMLQKNLTFSVSLHRYLPRNHIPDGNDTHHLLQTDI